MPTSPSPRLVIPLLAALIIAIFYGAASWNNQFIYDDHEVIENQYPIHHFGDFARIFREPHYLNFPYYRPITRTTFAIQSTIWGRNPRPYHIFNALLAGAVMLAAYGLLRRSAFDLHWLAALLATLWFSLHPAFSECVYPAASGRETLLPALFIILTMWAYLGRGLAWFCAAMLLFVVSLLCKEQAAVLPGLFVIADLLRLTEFPRKPLAWIGRYLPVAVIFTLYFLVRHLIFGHQTLHLTVTEHPLETYRSFLYGIQTAITPFVALRYEPLFYVWQDSTLGGISVAVFAVLLVGIFFARKPARYAIIFWFAWFILIQLPTAHIVQQEAAYSERYVALAILALPAIVAILLQNFSLSAGKTKILAAFALIWIFVLVTISYFRGAFYSTEFAFANQWQLTNPYAAGPFDGLGRIAQEQHQPRLAIDAYEKALALEPDDATARNNLANLLADIGDFAGASQQYEWLLKNPAVGADPAATMTNYAQLLGQEAFSRKDAAMRDRAHHLLEQAIDLRSDYAQAHYVLGLWNVAFGSRQAAIRQFKIALNLKPNWKEVEVKLQSLEQMPSTQP